MFDFKSLSYYYYLLKGSSQFGLPRQLLGPCYGMAINRLFYLLGLAIYIFKSMLRQMKNYGNSNISPCKNIIFKKSSKRNQNLSRYYNSITNLRFQHKPKYHLSKILI
jgi:hypothetical protein